MTKKSIPFIVLIHTIAVALFADVRCVNWALVYGEFLPEGIMNIFYPVVIGTILITALFHTDKLFRKGNGYAYFVIFYILASYFLTLFIWGPPRISLVMFLALSVFAFLIPLFCRIDARYFIKGIMFYPFFAVFRLNSVFQMVTEWQDFMNMDASYSFLVPVIANIVYLRFFVKEESFFEKIVTCLLSLCNLLFCFRILAHGSRAVVFSIFLLLLFFFIVHIKPNNKGIIIHKVRLRIAVVAMVVIAISYISVFSYVDKYLESKTGMSFYAIEKIARMGAEGDFDNGRNSIAKVAIDGFWDHPIMGHGIDRFEANTGQNYPHNFILEILFDGGLVLFFILLVPFLFSILKFFRRCTKNELAVFCALFFSSVPGALFSQDLYGMPVLWMTFGYCLSKGFVRGEFNDIKIHTKQNIWER